MTAVPSPADVAARDRRRLDELARVLSWNHQMSIVVEVILEATAAGRGVIISVSHTSNRVKARSSTHVAVGRAAIFDHDKGNDARPTFRTIRIKNL